MRYNVCILETNGEEVKKIFKVVESDREFRAVLREVTNSLSENQKIKYINESKSAKSGII